MIFLYNIFIAAYQWGVKIASLWSPKAKDWVEGRKGVFQQLEQTIAKEDALIWIHSSSAGEFEQAKPVIEQLKIKFPAYKVLVTFFSPSGYHAAKKYTAADFIFYLPIDTAAHAKRFLALVHPQLVIFVKYDFWYHYLKTVSSKKISLLLISAVFRKNQLFFKKYGSFYRKMLSFFSWIFVQDDTSLSLLQQYGITHSSKSGDTRFDRVQEIAAHFADIPFINDFIQTDKVLVAGSTWPDDEAMLAQWAKATGGACKIIIAPHEIHPGHVEKIERIFPSPVLYSQLKKGEKEPNPYQTLIIDNVGMLSRLYYYATITYVGGGFTKDGIHNTLEAAVYGKPVLFGPNYQKYREAKDLIEGGGGFNVATAEALTSIITNLLNNKEMYQQACSASLQYIQRERGATAAILEFIYKNRLLTN